MVFFNCYSFLIIHPSFLLLDLFLFFFFFLLFLYHYYHYYYHHFFFYYYTIVEHLSCGYTCPFASTQQPPQQHVSKRRHAFLRCRGDGAQGGRCSETMYRENSKTCITLTCVFVRYIRQRCCLFIKKKRKKLYTLTSFA